MRERKRQNVPRFRTRSYGPLTLSRYPSVLGPAYAILRSAVPFTAPLSLGPLSSIPYTPLRIRRVNNPIKKEEKEEKEKKEREEREGERRRERFPVSTTRSSLRASGRGASGR